MTAFTVAERQDTGSETSSTLGGFEMPRRTLTLERELAKMRRAEVQLRHEHDRQVGALFSERRQLREQISSLEARASAAERGLQESAAQLEQSAQKHAEVELQMDMTRKRLERQTAELERLSGKLELQTKELEAQTRELEVQTAELQYHKHKCITVERQHKNISSEFANVSAERDNLRDSILSEQKHWEVERSRLVEEAASARLQLDQSEKQSEKLSQKVSQLERAAAQQIARLRASEETTEKLQREHESTVKRIAWEHQERVHQMQSEYEERIDTVEQALENASGTYRELHAAETRRLSAEFAAELRRERDAFLRGRLQLEGELQAAVAAGKKSSTLRHEICKRWTEALEKFVAEHYGGTAEGGGRVVFRLREALGAKLIVLPEEEEEGSMDETGLEALREAIVGLADWFEKLLSDTEAKHDSYTEERIKELTSSLTNQAAAQINELASLNELLQGEFSKCLTLIRHTELLPETPCGGEQAECSEAVYPGRLYEALRFLLQTQYPSAIEDVQLKAESKLLAAKAQAEDRIAALQALLSAGNEEQARVSARLTDLEAQLKKAQEEIDNAGRLHANTIMLRRDEEVTAQSKLVLELQKKTEPLHGALLDVECMVKRLLDVQEKMGQQHRVLLAAQENLKDRLCLVNESYARMQKYFDDPGQKKADERCRAIVKEVVNVIEAYAKKKLEWETQQTQFEALNRHLRARLEGMTTLAETLSEEVDNKKANYCGLLSNCGGKNACPK